MFSMVTISRSISSVLAAVCLSSTGFADVFYSQVLTDWIVSVKDDVSAEQCAKEIQSQTNYSVNQVLPSIGIVVVTSPTSDGSKLAKVPCVLGYELNQEVHSAGQ